MAFDFPLALYAFLGPGLWLLLALGLLTARVRMGKLQRRGTRPPLSPDDAPDVTVIVPARNEAPGIRACISSVLAMHYPAPGERRFRVIAVDDRSTDGTAEIMDDIARTEPRLTVLRLVDKPDDWLGKCHAIWKAVEHLDTALCPNRTPSDREQSWLLLVDSDVTVRPDALLEVMTQARHRGADAVSILTRQRCDTLVEKLLTPVGCAAILAMYVASWTNEDNRRGSAFANGQFFLIRRGVYDRVGGHAAVRHEPVEDVMLMRRLKAAGAKCRLYSGDHLAETRMYDTLARMFKGWARIYSGASARRPWRILLGSVFVLSGLSAFVMLPWAVLGGGGLGWTALAAVHLAAVLAVMAAVYRWSGNSPWLAALFPVAGGFQLAFYSYALWWCATNRMEWRGTAYSTPPAS